MNKYIRSERADLFEPNVYIGLAVYLAGGLQSEEIERAVYKAYTANEATVSRIVLKADGNAYYEKMESSGCKFYIDSRPWKMLLCESEKSPFALEKGELVRTFLTEENGQWVLFIHAHHIVGDGQSVLILLKDIVKSLNGQSNTYKPMLSVGRDFLEKRAKLTKGAELYTEIINCKWRKNGKSFTWDDYYAIHRSYWNKYVSEIDCKTYNVKDIKAGCQKNVTINSYMITELLREYPECRNVGIPVSIRVDNGMSNQTSGIEIKSKYDSKKTFEENANKVHRTIYRKLRKTDTKYFILLFMERLCPSLIDAVLLQSHGCYHSKVTEKMAKVMGYIGDRGRDLGVTNLNKIDIQSVNEGFVINNIIFVPPKVSYTKNVVGISTYGDSLTVCHHRMRRKE